MTLAPELVNIFINDLDDVAVDDTKLVRVADKTKVLAATQRKYSRLKGWANPSYWPINANAMLIKFNKGKCKVLHLGKSKSAEAKKKKQTYKRLDKLSCSPDTGGTLTQEEF